MAQHFNLADNGSFLKTFEDIASELGISLCVHWKGFLSALKFGVVTFISFNPLVWFYFIFYFFQEFSQTHSMPLTINILQSFKHLIDSLLKFSLVLWEAKSRWYRLGYHISTPCLSSSMRTNMWLGAFCDELHSYQLDRLIQII